MGHTRLSSATQREHFLHLRGMRHNHRLRRCGVGVRRLRRRRGKRAHLRDARLRRLRAGRCGGAHVFGRGRHMLRRRGEPLLAGTHGLLRLCHQRRRSVEPARGRLRRLRRGLRRRFQRLNS